MTDAESDTDQTTWKDVERVIRDLKADGYEPVDFETTGSDATPEKSVLLAVER